jgi:hypothetical protein
MSANSGSPATEAGALIAGTAVGAFVALAEANQSMAEKATASQDIRGLAQKT